MQNFRITLRRPQSEETFQETFSGRDEIEAVSQAEKKYPDCTVMKWGDV